ncbi:hypothetical protein I601_4079 [Nocardioides dokdonensis FR1436]|uniref:Uncharacterized protein n=1 Tax=Nocardioides dokdonensis FR1436 TaxID=1300347 RepID=A0A1A9GSL5_9ACTN|nr:hypothetical protein [Nocardioides dokdonensis]ANH40475.1 hypothetical protein I601_4079 [Nocardioides dokdonensis FR1436]
MTDGRDHVRRSKRYPWSATDHGYPFYGRWDFWAGTLLTVLVVGALTVALVPSDPARIAVALVGVAVGCESSRAALGVFRSDREHRARIAEAMSEETGAAITVDQLASLYGRLHRDSGDIHRKTPKRATESRTEPDGSTLELTMFRDETVTAVWTRTPR